MSSGDKSNDRLCIIGACVLAIFVASLVLAINDMGPSGIIPAAAVIFISASILVVCAYDVFAGKKGQSRVPVDYVRPVSAPVSCPVPSV